MKPFGMLKIPMILVGLGAALVFSPASKAQEVSPDHFTDTGVQDVYNPAPSTAPAAKPKQKAPATQQHSHSSSAALQPVAKRTPVSAAQPGARALADNKRKSAANTPKKP